MTGPERSKKERRNPPMPAHQMRKHAATSCPSCGGLGWIAVGSGPDIDEPPCPCVERDQLRRDCAELERQRSAVLGFLDDVNRAEWASKVLISTAIRSAYGLERDSWDGA